MDTARNQDWVISGMSGRFPESENLEIFWDNLRKGKDMVSENDERWERNAYDIPLRTGKIPSIDKFDASFFGVSGTQAHRMDPKTRTALEVAYEAIVDAGVNPKSLDGSPVGVFMASSFSEAVDIWIRSNENPTGHYMSGCHPSMLADRISYAFNFNGPSCVFDSGCSASFSALQYAVLALKSGVCESAIVGGANINLLPLLSKSFVNFNAISADGKCKVFDASCDGYVRSEAVVALYICRGDRAKRSYATIAAIKCLNDGYKPEGVSMPSVEMQAQLIKNLYVEAGVNPLEVAYVEAHGTGTKAGDPKEIEALAQVFCKGRKEPLLVGSVKSNMGHPEPVSGLCGIVKVLLSRRAGILPPNLHYTTPNPECPALVDGRIQVVTTESPFSGNVVGVSSFGIGGTSGHLVLRFENERTCADTETTSPLSMAVVPLVNGLQSPDPYIKLSFDSAEWKHARESTTNEDIPTLILASGRTNEAVEHFLKESTSVSTNNDFVGLLHEITKIDTARHSFLGYAIKASPVNCEFVIAEKPETQKSMWFVFTGLGSQWIGMTDDMMKFKTFKNSIDVSSKTLKKVGMDLNSILQTQDLEKLNSLQNAFVSIVACQIALTDLLRSLDIVPEGIIGHSLGECACAYADGCLTQEQTLLIAFYRAKAFQESDLPPGTLASIGMTWEDAQKLCPSDIFPAIYYSEDNVTLGGPVDSIYSFVDQLKSQGIFAKVVKSAMHAFHTQYVQKSEHLMLKMLKEIIHEPKRRSNKWLSSSVPAKAWASDLALYSSAEYFVNNAVSAVNLYEALKYTPDNCIALEIGPHCFLQSLIKQTLTDSAIVIGLMHCKRDNRTFFLKALGEMFFAGHHFNAAALYKPVMFPVPLQTPSISNLIKWDHSISWDVPHHKNEISGSHSAKFIISTSAAREYSGHGLHGKIVFPATGYICLVWKAFAKRLNINYENLPICFENVSLKRMTELVPNVDIEFHVNILSESGNFEVTEGGEIVCDGSIRRAAGPSGKEMFSLVTNEKTSENVLVKEDFYKVLHLRGYDYQGLFQGVLNTDMDGKWAEVEWNENWVSFLDTMIQPKLLDLPLEDLVVPTRLDGVTIYPDIFKAHLQSNSGAVLISIYKYLDLFQCPGIQIHGFKPTTLASSKEISKPTITVQKFIPYFDPPEVTVSMEEAIEFFLMIVVDNSFPDFDDKFVFTEILEDAPSNRPYLQPLLYLHFVSLEHRIVGTKRSDDSISCNNCQNYNDIRDLKPLAKSHCIWIDHEDKIRPCLDLLLDNGFIMLSTSTEGIDKDLNIVASKRIQNEMFYLLRKATRLPSNATLVAIDSSNFTWVENLRNKLINLKSQQKIHILSMSSNSGILGFIKCLLKEPGSSNLRCIHIQSELNFDIHAASLDLLKLDLVFNVYKNETWGSYANFVVKDLKMPRPSEHVYGDIKCIGDLSSLHWVESPCKLGQREYYQIHYAALNFKDIMYATGKLPRSAFPEEVQSQECILGLEFSGIFRNKRVCGMSKGNSLGTVMDRGPYMVLEVPDQWSLAEAATIPTVYATALYSLLIRGQLREHESILIHSGSGGVGIASITVALAMNCKVFTTVGSEEKRKFLLKMFPALQAEQILDSSNALSFREHIMRQTNGRGVDMVLNSLAQEKFIGSLNCLAHRGRFLDIGKYDAFKNTAVGMAVLLKSVNIQGIHLDYIVANSEEGLQLQTLVQTFLNDGKIKPLPFTCFSNDELPEAFKYLASRQHVGKVIIKLRETSVLPKIPAIPRTYFYDHKTYIMIGGLGGMGLEILGWMIKRGARKFFIVSRSGITTSYQKYMIKKWRETGVKLFLRNTNISISAEVATLLKETIQEGPLGGVFNLAIVLQDAAFVNQSSQAFEAVSGCKANATMHFDTLTRQCAPNLDYFVVFSSVACGRGNAGQSNYGYANSVMERICEQRKLDGLPALAVQWGPVADVGQVAKAYKGKTVLVGAVGQPISCCIRTFDLLLQQTETIVTSFCLPAEEGKVSCLSTVKSLAQQVADILGVQDLAKVDLNCTLTDHGMDSIMAAQVRLAIIRKKNLFIPASAYGNLTFRDLIAMNE